MTILDRARDAADERLTLPPIATRKQVAQYTQTSIPTLARWAAEGVGPKVTRLGPGAIRYKREHVEAWIAEAG
ncbi:MAG: helix-turn-helix transcriptional regulator [Microbacterium gubbeenense]